MYFSVWYLQKQSITRIQLSCPNACDMNEKMTLCLVACLLLFLTQRKPPTFTLVYVLSFKNKNSSSKEMNLPIQLPFKVEFICNISLPLLDSIYDETFDLYKGLNNLSRSDILYCKFFLVKSSYVHSLFFHSLCI